MDINDEGFWSDMNLNEPTTYPAPVSPDEEKELDETIKTEILPAVTRFRLAHAANLDAAVACRKGGVKLESEDDVAAFYIQCYSWQRTISPNEKRLLVSCWRSVHDRPIYASWHKFGYEAMEYVCRASSAKGSEFARVWFAQDIDAILRPDFKEVVELVARVAAKFGASHPVECLQLPFAERKPVERLMKKFRHGEEDFELSLARLADAVKRMGFPVLTGISTAIAYSLNPDLGKAM